MLARDAPAEHARRYPVTLRGERLNGFSIVEFKQSDPILAAGRFCGTDDPGHYGGLMKTVSIAILTSLAFSGLASASITTSIVGTPTADGPDYLWNYQISVDALEQLVDASSTPCTSALTCGSFFTIYDFVGYVAGSVTAPTGWTAQVSLTGLTNPSQSPTDSGSIVNLTFIYTGSPSPEGGPITDLTGFSAQSNSDLVNTGGAFTYQTEKLDGTVDAGIGAVDVPTVATPEPGTEFLLGGALIGLAALHRRSKQRPRNN